VGNTSQKGNFMIIAERVLELVPTNGAKFSVTLKVYAPTKIDSGNEWVCKIEAHGLLSDPLTAMLGRDTWQALLHAQRHLVDLLITETNKGSKLFWPPSSDEIHPTQLFPVSPSLK